MLLTRMAFQAEVVQRNQKKTDRPRFELESETSQLRRLKRLLFYSLIQLAIFGLVNAPLAAQDSMQVPSDSPKNSQVTIQSMLAGKFSLKVKDTNTPVFLLGSNPFRESNQAPEYVYIQVPVVAYQPQSDAKQYSFNLEFSDASEEEIRSFRQKHGLKDDVVVRPAAIRGYRVLLSGGGNASTSEIFTSERKDGGYNKGSSLLETQSGTRVFSVPSDGIRPDSNFEIQVEFEFSTFSTSGFRINSNYQSLLNEIADLNGPTASEVYLTRKAFDHYVNKARESTDIIAWGNGGQLLLDSYFEKQFQSKLNPSTGSGGSIQPDAIFHLDENDPKPKKISLGNYIEAGNQSQEEHKKEYEKVLNQLESISDEKGFEEVVKSLGVSGSFDASGGVNIFKMLNAQAATAMKAAYDSKMDYKRYYDDFKKFYKYSDAEKNVESFFAQASSYRKDQKQLIEYSIPKSLDLALLKKDEIIKLLSIGYSVISGNSITTARNTFSIPVLRLMNDEVAADPYGLRYANEIGKFGYDKDRRLVYIQKFDTNRWKAIGTLSPAIDPNADGSALFGIIRNQGVFLKGPANYMTYEEELELPGERAPELVLTLSGHAFTSAHAASIEVEISCDGKKPERHTLAEWHKEYGISSHKISLGRVARRVHLKFGLKCGSGLSSGEAVVCAIKEFSITEQ